MAILMPESTIRAAETPSYHNHRLKGRWEFTVLVPCVTCFVKLHSPEVADLGAEILVSLDVETPWLDGHPGVQFYYQGGGDTFLP